MQSDFFFHPFFPRYRILANHRDRNGGKSSHRKRIDYKTLLVTPKEFGSRFLSTAFRGCKDQVTMKTWFTTVKYAPNPDREEYFGIGLIMVSPESGAVKVRFSRERVNLINRALGIEKSSLLESAMRQAEGFVKSQDALDVKHLEYLSVYENGVIRYTAPKPLVIAHDNPDESAADLVEQRFNRLYHKLIDDKQEKRTNSSRSNNAFATAFRRMAKENFDFQHYLNIDYKLESEELQTEILLPEIRLDFIGGNGSIYCGHILNLNTAESTLSENISKTISLYDCLNKLYGSSNQKGKKEQKIILDKKQAEQKEAKQALNLIELVTDKKPYEVVQVSDTRQFMNDVLEEVKEKGVEPFSSWINKHQAHTLQ